MMMLVHVRMVAGMAVNGKPATHDNGDGASCRAANKKGALVIPSADAALAYSKWHAANATKC